MVGTVRLLRGSMTLRRMNAYRLVLAAAALTVFVTAALASALAIFTGQALPQAAHRELAAAPGVWLDISRLGDRRPGRPVPGWAAGRHPCRAAGRPGHPATRRCGPIRSGWPRPGRPGPG